MGQHVEWAEPSHRSLAGPGTEIGLDTVREHALVIGFDNLMVVEGNLDELEDLAIWLLSEILAIKHREPTEVEKAERRVQEHRRWLAKHGGDLAGYVARYGSINHAIHYGDGGEAIYAADLAALSEAEDALRALKGNR